MLADVHGRDHVAKARLAVDADGKFLALHADVIANMGAYLSQFAPFIRPTADRPCIMALTIFRRFTVRAALHQQCQSMPIAVPDV